MNEVLYLRWDRRAGGVTEGWRSLSRDRIVEGLRANASAMLAAIEGSAAGAAELRVLTLVVYLRLMARVRTIERRLETTGLISASELNPAFADLSPPADLSDYGPEVEAWVRKRWARLDPG